MKPLTRPTRAWALKEALRYLAGGIDADQFLIDIDAALDYYRNPRLRVQSSVVGDFLGSCWGRALRVKRGIVPESELRELVTEWLPDLQTPRRRPTSRAEE